MSGLMMKYFVLKPHGDDHYAKASRAAMRTYAKHISDENRELCNELMEWVDRESPVPEDCVGHNEPAKGPPSGGPVEPKAERT